MFSSVCELLICVATAALSKVSLNRASVLVSRDTRSQKKLSSSNVHDSSTSHESYDWSRDASLLST